MISLVFGLPRSGKTSYLVWLAKHSSKKYKYIYTNVYLSNMPDNVYYISTNIIGRYNLHDCLILIDEASMSYDNRDYKSLPNHVRDWLMLHGHYHCDVIFFCQIYNAVDAKIRRLCENVYRIKKSRILPFLSVIEPIVYGQYVGTTRDNLKSKGTKYSDIDEGYYRLPFLSRLFCRRIYRRPLYKHFDSFEDVLHLPNMPQEQEDSVEM